MPTRKGLSEPPFPPSRLPATNGDTSRLERVAPVRCWSLAYLTTGVLVSVIAQKVASSPGVDPALHVIPAAKWVSTLFVSLVVHTFHAGDRQAKAHVENEPGGRFQTKAMTAVLGALDCAAYVLFCLGLGRCGAATAGVVLPAMGHVLTAFFSITLLRNKLSRRRTLAVGLVFLGVLAKGWEVDFSTDLNADARVGFGYLGLASLCYSSMGVIYESILRFGSAPRHATITLYSSVIGTLSYGVYLFAYSFRLYANDRISIQRWMGERILQIMNLQGMRALSMSSIIPAGTLSWVRWLALFALLYNAHVYVQGMTFRSDGALGVQLVNSVRGCTAYMVFCFLSGPPGTWQKSEIMGLVSGALAAIGGVLWIDVNTEKQNP